MSWERRRRRATVTGWLLRLTPRSQAIPGDDAPHRTAEPHEVLHDEWLVEVERIDPGLDQQMAF